MATSGEDLVVRFVERCRQSLVILPAETTIERLCADALVNAERQIETRIADRLVPEIQSQLLALLNDTVDDRMTRFVWLRQFEPGANSARRTSCWTGWNICSAWTFRPVCSTAFHPSRDPAAPSGRTLLC